MNVHTVTVLIVPRWVLWQCHSPREQITKKQNFFYQFPIATCIELNPNFKKIWRPKHLNIDNASTATVVPRRGLKSKPNTLIYVRNDLRITILETK